MLNTITAILDAGAGGGGTAYESISTVTVGAGGVASVTFSSLPTSYAALQFRISARSTLAGTNADNVAFRINGNTSSIYTTHRLRATSSVVSDAFANLDYGYFPSAVPAAGNLSNTFAGIIADFHDYNSSTKTKTIRVFSGFDENGSSGNAGSPNVQLSSCLFNSTSAMSSIVFQTSGNIAEGSVFSLYGIKGA